MNRPFVVVLLALLLMTFSPVIGQADTILRYAQRINVTEDNQTKVSIYLIVRASTARPLRVPLAFRLIDHVTYDEAHGHRVSVDSSAALSVLIIDHLKSDPDTILVEFMTSEFVDWSRIKRGAFGNYVFAHRFVHTEHTDIAHYSSEIILPPGFVVNSIVESNPRFTESDPKAPYEVGMVQKRHSITLTRKNMKIGDVAMISIRVKKPERSPFLLGAIVLAGILYLVLYRDIVTKRPSRESAPLTTSVLEEKAKQ